MGPRALGLDIVIVVDPTKYSKSPIVVALKLKEGVTPMVGGFLMFDNVNV